MNPLPPCPRCGGCQYRDTDTLGRESLCCLMCGEMRWPAPPVPWTPYHGLPRPPVWTGTSDDA